MHKKKHTHAGFYTAPALSRVAAFFMPESEHVPCLKDDGFEDQINNPSVLFPLHLLLVLPDDPARGWVQ